jgi:RNA polymerase sigma-70 factor (ECF subfamily)
MQVTDFEAERTRLTAIATRILGSAADADDVLQEAWLRLSRTDDIEDLPSWLTTVVTRLCLDQLRKRRTRPVAEAEVRADPAPVDPEADALLAEKTGDAMQVVLDTLAPAERAAFVLHDVFGYPFDEISAVMGRSGSAVRQLASRARRKVQGVPEPVASQAARAENQQVVEAFLAAARGGDLATLLLLLAPDAIMRADLVGQKMGTDPVYDGAAAVAARFNGARGAAPVTIDGDLGAAWIHAGSTKVAFVFHVEAGLVREVELIAAPDVLATMDIVRVRVKSREVDAHGPRWHPSDSPTQ